MHSQGASRISYSLFASKQWRREFSLKHFCVTSDDYAYVGLHGRDVGKCNNGDLFSKIVQETYPHPIKVFALAGLFMEWKKN